MLTSAAAKQPLICIQGISIKQGINGMELLPDVLLAFLITSVGICIMLARNLRIATGLFIVLCVIISLGWMRLQLFWLGVAEAFIGAILTGLTVRSAIGLTLGMKGPDAGDVLHSTPSRWPHLFLPLAGALVFIGLAVASGFYFQRLFSLSVCAVYAVAGIAISGCGFFTMVYRTNLLQRVLAFNLFGRGVFLFIVVLACQGSLPMDAPVFMAASGLLVLCIASFLVVTMIGRYHDRAELQLSEDGTPP
jgi:multisubunit Na+/H+ antiporter MnhC subunit